MEKISREKANSGVGGGGGENSHRLSRGSSTQNRTHCVERFPRSHFFFSLILKSRLENLTVVLVPETHLFSQKKKSSRGYHLSKLSHWAFDLKEKNYTCLLTGQIQPITLNKRSISALTLMENCCLPFIQFLLYTFHNAPVATSRAEETF